MKVFPESLKTRVKLLQGTLLTVGTLGPAIGAAKMTIALGTPGRDIDAVFMGIITALVAGVGSTKALFRFTDSIVAALALHDRMEAREEALPKELVKPYRSAIRQILKPGQPFPSDEVKNSIDGMASDVARVNEELIALEAKLICMEDLAKRAFRTAVRRLEAGEVRTTAGRAGDQLSHTLLALEDRLESISGQVHRLSEEVSLASPENAAPEGSVPKGLAKSYRLVASALRERQEGQFNVNEVSDHVERVAADVARVNEERLALRGKLTRMVSLAQSAFSTVVTLDEMGRGGISERGGIMTLYREVKRAAEELRQLREEVSPAARDQIPLKPPGGGISVSVLG